MDRLVGMTPTIADPSNPAASVAAAPSLAALFLAFLRLGATAFGGPAMVAYIKDLAVARRGWLAEADFQDGVALCQTIPGATAMQTTAYVGLRTRGVPGGVIAYVAFGLPAFGLMVGLTALYLHTRAWPVTISMFLGLTAVVVALTANAACTFASSSITNWRGAALAAAATVALTIRINPILVIAGCGIVGAGLLRGGNTERTSRGDLSRHRDVLYPTLALAVAAGGAVALLFWMDRQLFELAVTMIRVDLLAFGGGFASVPLMQHEVAEVRGWMPVRTFMDGIALGQVTPGPIVITATFVGYLCRGIPGAVVATMGIFSPSFLMVALIMPHFDRLQRLAIFRGATRGALLSFVGLLAAVTVRFGLATSWTIRTAILALVAFVALRLRIDVLWVVLGGVFVSLLPAW
ncbi:MAG: chromate efflux transporter [Acidobacteria bacterium]|nr:chromate efflux transporter [Acidobacteriota bacterium]